MTIRARPNIVLREFMSTFAMRLGAELPVDWITTIDIDRISHSFEVCRIYAERVSTKMVNGQASRNWPHPQLIGGTMSQRAFRSRTEIERAVFGRLVRRRSTFITGPHPTASRIGGTINRWSRRKSSFPLYTLFVHCCTPSQCGRCLGSLLRTAGLSCFSFPSTRLVFPVDTSDRDTPADDRRYEKHQPEPDQEAVEPGHDSRNPAAYADYCFNFDCVPCHLSQGYDQRLL